MNSLCDFLLLLSQCSTKFPYEKHNNLMYSLKKFQTIVQSWFNNLVYNNVFLFPYRFFLASWRIKYCMLFVDDPKRLDKLTIMFYKKFLSKIFPLSSIDCVLSNPMNQIFFLNIHHFSERNHLWYRMLFRYGK